jgi:hypothetical protein
MPPTKGKGLAGWAAGNETNRARVSPEIHVARVGLDKRPIHYHGGAARLISAEHFAAGVVAFDHGRGLEPGQMETEAEPADAREEFDGFHDLRASPRRRESRFCSSHATTGTATPSPVSW